MKTQVLIALCFLLIQIGNVTPVQAQLPIVMEMIPNADGLDYVAYVVTIPIAQVNKVKGNWSDYIGQDSYGWPSEKNGIHRQRGIVESTISPKKFTVYSEFVTTESGVRLTAWFTQKKSPLVASKSGDKLDLAIKKYIHFFAIRQYRSAIQIQLKKEQNLRRKQEMRLASLLRTKEHDVPSISDSVFEEQERTLTRSIESQNSKMQKLLDLLSDII